MTARTYALVLAAATSLGLAACHRDRGDESHPAPPPGTTGSGTQGMGAPGTGLNGGLGTTQPGQPTGVAEGSGNRTTKSNVGNR